MKLQLGLGAATLLGIGSLVGFHDGADVVRTVDVPVAKVYREFSYVFEGSDTARTFGPGELPNGLAGVATTRFVRIRNEELAFAMALDGRQMARIAFRFEPVGESQTRIKADFDVDAAILPTGEDRLSQWQVDTVVKLAATRLVDDAVADLNRGASLRMALDFSGADFGRSASRLMRDDQASSAEREYQARKQQESASAPMVDPDAVARKHIRETQGPEALKNSY